MRSGFEAAVGRQKVSWSVEGYTELRSCFNASDAKNKAASFREIAAAFSQIL